MPHYFPYPTQQRNIRHCTFTVYIVLIWRCKLAGRAKLNTTIIEPKKNEPKKRKRCKSSKLPFSIVEIIDSIDPMVSMFILHEPSNIELLNPFNESLRLSDTFNDTTFYSAQFHITSLRQHHWISNHFVTINQIYILLKAQIIQSINLFRKNCYVHITCAKS